MSKLTKSCAVRSCKFSKGTRENVKMFRVPTDVEWLKLWKNAFGLKENEMLKGLICMNHFEEKDVSVGKTNIRLKKGAIPRYNITSVSNCSNGLNTNNTVVCDFSDYYEEYEKLESDEGDEENETSEISEIREEIKKCEKCETIEIELEALRKEYLEMKLKYGIKISKLENDLIVAQKKIETKTHDTILYKKQLNYAKCSKEKLNVVLNDLKAENLLAKDVLNFVQVIKLINSIVKAAKPH